MNGYTIYFLIIGIISSLTCVMFTSLMLRNFVKKRTLGTLLLVLTYLTTTIAEIMTCTSYFLETFAAGTSIRTAIEFLTFTGYLFFAINIIFIYVFGNRIFLQDNQLVSLLYIAGFAFTAAFPAGLVYKNIFSLHNPDLYQEVILAAPQLTVIFPLRSFALLAIMLPIAISAFLRIVIEAIKLQRGTKDPIARKGFQFIWQGTFFWYLGYNGLYGLLFMVDAIATNPYLLVGMFTFKLVFADIIGFALLYLGWSMPDWFKRRFRKKTWLAKVHTGEIHVEQTTTAASYIPSNNLPKNDTTEIQVVEITEE